MNPYPAELWSNYFVAHLGAASTLVGLVFVSVSINLSRIMAIAGLPGRAAESLLQFFGVLVISSIALVPRQPAIAFGIELIGAGVLLWSAQTKIQFHYHRIKDPSHPQQWLLDRVLFTQLSTWPFCIAGLELLLNARGAIYWIVPGFLFSLMAGVISAWVLLVEILR